MAVMSCAFSFLWMLVILDNHFIRVYHLSKSWTCRLKFKSDHSRCVFNDLFECWNLQLLRFTFGLGDLKIFKLNLYDRGCIKQSQCTNILINIPTIKKLTVCRNVIIVSKDPKLKFEH